MIMAMLGSGEARARATQPCGRAMLNSLTGSWTVIAFAVGLAEGDVTEAVGAGLLLVAAPVSLRWTGLEHFRQIANVRYQTSLPRRPGLLPRASVWPAASGWPPARRRTLRMV